MSLLRLASNLYFQKKEPLSLIHFVTHRCNARCKHCFIDFDNPKIYRNELSLSEIEKFTKSLGDSLFNVNLTGGEPFLREDIFDILYLYCKNARVRSISIATNGMLTDKVENFIKKFRESRIKTNLTFTISIDNFESLHDKNRNLNGSFRSAINTYRMIKSYRGPRIDATIGITVTPYNHENVISLYDYLKNRGIKSISAILMREEGVIKKIHNKKRVLNVYKKLSAMIDTDQTRGETIGLGDIRKGLFINARDNLIHKILCEIYLSKKFISYCPAGALFGVIFGNGDVFPCEILGNYKLGNLRDYDMDFMKLWNNRKVTLCKKYIKESRCSCTFECAWSINVLSNPRFIPQLLFYLYKNIKWNKKKP